MSKETCRMEVCQLLRNIIEKRQNFISQRPKKLERNWNSSKVFFSLNCSYGHVECNFRNTDEKNSTEGPKNFAYCPKTIGKTKSFTKTFFAPNIPEDT